MAVRLVVRHRNSAAGEAGDLSFEFEQARIVIGRSPGADVRLPDAAVSETHATLERRGAHYAVRDERSRNGTLVNGVPLVPERPRLLAPSDEIGIADFRLRFAETAVVRVLTSPERTASLARRMLRELLGQEHEASSPPELKVVEGPNRGAVVRLPRAGAIVIGSGVEAGLRLSDAAVESAHIRVESDADGGVVAREASDRRGFEVNGKPVRERRLRHGDLLALGSTRISFDDQAERALRSLERQPVRTLTQNEPRANPPQADAAPAERAEIAAPEALGAAEKSSIASDGDDAHSQTSALDYLVYALATLILATSVIGLVWLLK